MSTSSTILEQLDMFLKAAEEAASEQGHVENQGDTGTSHPSKGVDDCTVPAPEGDRSAENSADVAATVPGQSPDEASTSGLDGGSKSPVTDAKFTGEDPQNETASVNPTPNNESGKDSQGNETSHPAKADFGGKYASIKEAALGIIDRINEFNAKIAAIDFTIEKLSNDEREEDKSEEAYMMENDNESSSKSEMKSENNNESSHKSEMKEDYNEEMAEEEGEKAAEAVLEQAQELDEQQRTLLLSTVKEAYDDANRLAEFYQGMLEAQQAVQEQSEKKASPNAKLQQILKKAMGHDEGMADAMAYGGDSEMPADTAEESAEEMAEEEQPGHDELEQILAELEAAGVDPELLKQIPPEELAKALAEAEAEGSAENPTEPMPAAEGVEMAAG